jgi:hypothetical protein
MHKYLTGELTRATLPRYDHKYQLGTCTLTTSAVITGYLSICLRVPVATNSATLLFGTPIGAALTVRLTPTDLGVSPSAC